VKQPPVVPRERELEAAREYTAAREAEGAASTYLLFTGVGAAGIIGGTIWGLHQWYNPGDLPATDHGLPLPAARGAVDRYNSALKEQLRHELSPRGEAPRRQDPAVRVTPYLSPLGAGIAGVF
jgi:hypothetical protein